MTTATLKAGSPARWAAYIGLMIGVGLIGLGGANLAGVGKQPIPLSVALVVLGVIELVTSWFSLRVVRSAWAFACSINGTMAVVMLFGAPKVRDTVEVFIGVALIPSFVFAVVTLLYAMASDDY